MSQITPVDKEFIFEGSAIISQTDLKGVITYANRKFCEVSGYTSDELVGQAHSIVRHPDMPSLAFKKMWDNLSTDHSWNGIVKNMRKDGLYYWVYAEITLIKDEDDNTTGYIASRKAASRKDIEEAQALYLKMNQDQN